MNIRRIPYLLRPGASSCYRRHHSSLPSGLALKYAEKLKARMESEGVNDLNELKTKLGPKPVEPVGKPVWKTVPEMAASVSSSSSSSQPRTKVSPTIVRKDSPPIKPLSSILNLSKLLESHPTQEQIAALWNLYHASKSRGTGRGYLSACVPVDKYEMMLGRAKPYPIFLLPLLRTATEEEDDGAAGEKKKQVGTEFFFLEWGFHSAPPPPHSSADPLHDALFNTKKDDPMIRPLSLSKPLPPITTVLFTTLQEYKLHGAFAPPRLVLTHYTDLAHTHGIVLLRGEITNSSSSGGYLLSQIDAQLLATGLQRFYLPVQGAEGEKAFELLKVFHEDPDRFEYEQLIEFRDPGLRPT